MVAYHFDSNSSFGTSYSQSLDPFRTSVEGFSGDLRGGPPMLSQALVLDSERGELVKSPARTGKKGVSEAKALAALKSHSEAERRRRERINSHLATLRGLVPCTEKVAFIYEDISCWYVAMKIIMVLTADAVKLHFSFESMESNYHYHSGITVIASFNLNHLSWFVPQMDKATLLAEVINQVKELKKTAIEACKGLLIPVADDEVKVEPHEGASGDGALCFSASLCCEYRPELLSDIRRAIDALQLKIVNAEVSTLIDRLKIELVCTSGRNTNAVNDDGEAKYNLQNSIHQALSSILEKGSVSPEYSPRTTLQNKRKRMTFFDSSSSSS